MKNAMHFDSISHRIMHLVISHPDAQFTIGQLLYAADKPVTTINRPSALPPKNLVQTRGSRTCSTQLRRLLADKLLVREQGASPLVGMAKVPPTQFLYKAGVRDYTTISLRGRNQTAPGATPNSRKGAGHGRNA